MTFIPSSGTGPKARRRLFVGTFPDGSQLMVEEWLDDDDKVRKVTAATRPTADTHVVWGPPVTLEERQ